MGKIFNLSFLIFCAVLPQLVVSVDENAESSSVLHVRQKRMNSPAGSSSSSSPPSPPLPPLFVHTLHEVNMASPTRVEISYRGISGPGFAIHPYFVLTRREYTTEGVRVLVHKGHSIQLVAQEVRECFPDITHEIVLIQLANPILLDNPVASPFSDERYEEQATEWAQAKVEKWIRYHEPNIQPLPQQSIREVRLYDPTEVVMTKDGGRIGPGFAVHPHIVITKSAFIRKTVGVSTFTQTPGLFKPHRVQEYVEFADVGLVLVRDPIPLTIPVPDALAGQHYSPEGAAFAKRKTKEWIVYFDQKKTPMQRPHD